MDVKGLKSLVATLEGRIAAAAKMNGASVLVGYTAAYAVYVHENMEAVHGEAFNAKYAAEIEAGTEHSRGSNQQAKFLETPARKLNNDGTLQGIILQAMRAGRTMAQALLLAGLRLQRESQLIVPIDIGNLRASAFTRYEGTLQ